MISWLKTAGPPLVILVAVLATYSRSLNNPFHFDDYDKIVANETIQNPGNVLRNIRPFSYGEFTTRPLVWLSLSLNYALGGLDPFGYHALDIGMHALACLLFFFLLKRVSKDSSAVPFLAALIFAVHPLQSEAVNYLNARPNIFVTVFGLLGLLLADQAACTTRSWIRRLEFFLGALIAFLAACLSKELGLVFFVLLPVYLMTFHGRQRFWPVALAGFVLAVAMAFVTGTLPEVKHLIGTTRVSDQLLTQSVVATRYLALALFPVSSFLNVDHDLELVTTVTVESAGSVAVLLGIVMLGVLRYSKRPILSFFVVWMFLTHAPTSLIPKAERMVEYRNYLPMVGFCALSAGALVAVWKRLFDRRPWVFSGIAGLGFVGGLAIVTHGRNAVWQDGISLWRDATTKSAGKGRVHANLALEYHRAGRLEEAFWAYRMAHRLRPDYGMPLYGLAQIYRARKMYPDAIEAIQEALTRDPQRLSLWVALAGIQGETKRWDLCEQALAKALAIDDNDWEALWTQGTLFVARGRFDDAESILLDLAKRKPFHWGAHASLGGICLKRGDLQAARRHLERAVMYGAPDSNVQVLLSETLRRMDDPH